MPEIPVGDVLRSVVKGGWLRKLLDLIKGLRITRGGTTIVLNEGHGATPPRTGLDQPGSINPPKVGPGRWPL